MRILVCGGRSYNNAERVNSALDAINDADGIDVIIHGGCSGADELARRWAASRKVECIAYPADWNQYGRAAGPIRNRSMITDGKPDIVVAFPGGRGTRDMCMDAAKFKIKMLFVNDHD
jgi:hypothetical protein